MILSKVLTKYRLTIPKAITKKIGIAIGDILKCEVKNGSIQFTPIVLEERDSKEELKQFNKLYNNSSNRGKKHSNTNKALEHITYIKQI